MFKKTPMKREGGNAEIDVDEIGQLMMQYDVGFELCKFEDIVDQICSVALQNVWF